MFSKRPHGVRKAVMRQVRLCLERLEDRTLPSTITWIAGSGNFDDPTNWSPAQVPGSSDVAVIDTASAATIAIQASDNLSVLSVGTGSNDTLTSAGALTVTSGTSALDGPLSLTGGSLTATGSGVVVDANGATTVAQASLYAFSGATVNVPGLSSYVSNDTNFQANGTGSEIDASGLTTLTQQGNWSITATGGGKIDLSGLQSLSGADGIFITDTGNSTILDGALTTLSGVTATLDGSDTQVAGAWTSFTDGSLTVRGGAYSLLGLTDVDGSNLFADGGNLNLPGVSGYTPLANNSNYLQAIGTSCVLDLSKLTTFTQQGNLNLDAQSGGELDLSDVAALNATSGNVAIDETVGGTILDGKLTTLTDVTATLNGTDTGVAAPWLSFTDGSLTVDGGSLALPNLTDVDGANLFANGGSLSLLGVSAYTPLVNNVNYFQATDTSCVLDLSKLTSLTQQGNLNLDARSGGELDLSDLTALNATTGTVAIDETVGGTILDGKLTSLTDVTATLNGTDTQVGAPWQSFTNGTLTIQGGALSLPSLTDIDGSMLFAEGGSLTLLGVTSFTTNPADYGVYSDYFEADGAGSALDLAHLTTINQQANWTFEALSGGAVNVSSLTALTAANGQIYINDTGNSSIQDGNLTTLNGVFVTVDGTDANVGATWTSFTNGNITETAGSTTFPVLTDGDLTVGGNGDTGTVVLPVLTSGDLTLNNGASATVEGESIAMPAAGSSGNTISVPASTALTVTLDNNGTLTGQTINAGAGSTVLLSGGTYLGTNTFNLQGATLNLGSTGTYGGTLTGTGNGSVQYDGGTLNIATGGLTLNFPGAMFQWLQGGVNGQLGNLTNLGTMTLAGSGYKEFYDDGTLFNYGTLIETGTANLSLHSDNVSPTTLVNEAGASLLMDGDVGIDNAVGGQTAIQNAGTIRKTTGSGVSLLVVNGLLINTGTIAADSGTVDLLVNSFNELSGATLTGGTWNALDGATLEFPAGSSIATNNAHVSLDGSGATITALAGLAANSGTLSLTGGASLTTSGGFSNSGALTVGAASTLNVGGSVTLAGGGTLDEQIGGTPASGQFGQVVATGKATLGGAFDLSLIDGAAASRGAVYPMLTYASSSGSFATVTGVSPFVEQVNPTSLDVVYGSGSAVDLQLGKVTAPTAATTGQPITVDWQVTDGGSQAAGGSWQDSVYLLTTPAITAASVLLGSVTHTNGLGAGATYGGSLTAAVPALPPGTYYVLVQVDSLDEVLALDRTALTAGAGTGLLAVSVPALTLGQATHGTFTAADLDQYYQVRVQAGGALTITLNSAAASGATALYVSQNVLPTPYDYQDAAIVTNQPNQTATVPQVVTPGTYYILAHSVSGSAATVGYTLTASQTTSLSVLTFSPTAGGITILTPGEVRPDIASPNDVTVEIDGTNFTPSVAATLSQGTATLTASVIDYVNPSQMFATFDLGQGALFGNCTLTVQQGAQTATGPLSFDVVPVFNTAPAVTLSAPEYVRSGRTATLVVNYANQTNDDLVAPLLDVASTNAHVSFSTPDDPNAYTQDAQLLGVASTGPAGILRPGESGQLTLTLLSNDTITNDEIPVTVTLVESGQTIDWAGEQAALQPPSIPAAAWSVIYGNVLATVGTTTDSYNAALAQAASYLSGIGDSPAQVSDVGNLWSFLVSQANATLPTTTLASAVDAVLPTPGSLALAIDRTFVSSIAGRYTEGIFGFGWTTSWQTSLSVDSAGNATIDSGGSLLYFPIQANGTYLGVAGETGALTLSAGVYTYTDSSGDQYVFLPDGLLNYEQDPNGNRIALGYNGNNQPITLTYSNPADPSEQTEQLALTYYATGPNAGLVQTESDGAGDVWTFSYDGAGHLTSVAAPGTGPSGNAGTLTTTYAYDTGANPETANALLSITSPDGSQQTFSYDSHTGQLTNATQPDGASTLSTAYTYPGEGEVTATDTAGNQTSVWFNELGLPARVETPRGGISSFLYDSNGNLVQSTDAAGDTYQYSYDANGDLTQVVNPLGQTDRFTYGPLGNVTSLTDAAGTTTQYQYDSAGNLLSIAYPDGTQQSFTYDPLGNLTETVLQNGDPISYQDNAQGQVALETFADGTALTFSYDAHGNLLTADTYSADGTLAGTTTLTYNAANQLLSVSYPGGLSLTFTYNAQGQRTQSVDQSGYTINYSYDALGRLAELTDGSSNLIVRYTYNGLGQLVEKQNGNGTYTTYAYDADGNRTDEINYANSGGSTINSSFTYTYNTLDQETAQTDNAGNTTTYAYDATGQLTLVTLPNGSTIQYVYNATGDRTEVVSAGTTTSYASNSDNEITQVGATTYTYDADGNLATMTDVSGTTTYTYNDLNQLVSITNPDGSVQSFQYNPLGFLAGTSTTSGGSTSQTDYLVDPTGLGNVVAAYSGSGTLIADYNYGLGLVSQTGPSGTGYYDFDASGNTAGITGSSGTYVNQYTYLPFGATTTVTAALPNPFTFGGQFGIAQLGSNLFYARAREYTPATGQFLSNDPAGLAAGDTNLRRYVFNAPTNATDPGGRAASFFDFAQAVTQANPQLVSQLSQEEAQALLQALYAASREGPANFTAAGRLLAQQLAARAAASASLSRLGSAIGAGAGKSALLALALYLFQHRAEIRHHIQSLDFNDPSYVPQFHPENLGAFGQALLKNLIPHDPNALVGPTGTGAQNLVAASATLPYTIDFENDGSVAAQDVTVTEQLDPNLDWSTFQLGSFSFGPIHVTVPAGLTEYQTTVAYQNIDDSALNVAVSVNFDVQTGLLTVTFTSLDPLTGQTPTGVTDGFLYPESDGLANSEGAIQYTISPNPEAVTGTIISAQASVVFDTNPALATNTVSNAILDVVTQTALSEPAGPSAPATEAISALLNGHYSDSLPNNKPGIAVFATSGVGTWQYSTNKKTWTTLAAVSTTSALLLPETDYLRFVPASLAFGSVAGQLLFAAWDGDRNTADHYANLGSTGGGSTYSASAGELDVTTTQTTALPVWLQTSTLLTPVVPGGPNTGETVAAAFGSLFSGDANQAPAVAVTGATKNANGTWQYALASSPTDFVNFPTLAKGSAFTLDAQDLIRFLPTNAGFDGSAALTVYAWAGAGDTTVKLTSTNVSSKALTATVHFNRAPTQNASSVTLFGQGIPVNDAHPPVVSVATLLTDSGAADADHNTLGLALTAASGTGTWQYELSSAGPWVNVPASLSAVSVLLLPHAAQVRFVPTVNEAGQATLTWQAWDDTQGNPGQAGVVPLGTGGAFAFSSNTATATLTVNAGSAPLSPAWSGTGAAFVPVVAGTVTQAGNTVAAVFGAYFKDPGVSAGIAVSAVSGTPADGVWYYSTDGGSTWTPLPAVSPSKALLLSANDEIAFVPKQGFRGEVSLTAYAWDGGGTGNQPGTQVKAKGHDFSSTTLTATCVVDTAPELTA